MKLMSCHLLAAVDAVFKALKTTPSPKKTPTKKDALRRLHSSDLVGRGKLNPLSKLLIYKINNGFNF